MTTPDPASGSASRRSAPEETVGDVLRLVAEGRLSAAEADVLLSALDAPGESADRLPEGRGRGSRGLQARIEVTEHGRSVVNLRVPLSLGRLALGHVPGLSEANIDRLWQAVERGLTGPILQVTEDNGDGVRIVIE